MQSLAILGGAPIRSAPINPWPHFDRDEIESVSAVLESGKVNYWTGHLTKQFENQFATYHGMKHGIGITGYPLVKIFSGDPICCSTFVCSCLRGLRLFRAICCIQRLKEHCSSVFAVTQFWPC